MFIILEGLKWRKIEKKKSGFLRRFVNRRGRVPVSTNAFFRCLHKRALRCMLCRAADELRYSESDCSVGLFSTTTKTVIHHISTCYMPGFQRVCSLINSPERSREILFHRWCVEFFFYITCWLSGIHLYKDTYVFKSYLIHNRQLFYIFF